MSSQWYYMVSGWIRKTHPVGPITEAELLERIATGKICPETLLKSDKTRNKWVPMNSVLPAMEHWQHTHPERN